MTDDERYMARCIQLARNGKRGAAPNPMVGAVIVCNNHIIGEGYHIRCGQPHAEVNAIRSVKDASLLEKSTIYVSLEPCSHYGKTPPCADLIISKRIPRVVVGCIDPFSKVAGEGIAKLRAAGIDVEVGVLEDECLRLNRRFITCNTRHRPFITLKWAQSADHFIDHHRSDASIPPVQFSTPLTAMMAHRLRAQSKAILVGRRTAELDNPSLNVRHWIGDSPLRLVIDRKLTLSPDLNLFDKSHPTWVFTEKERASTHENLTYCRLDFSTDILPQLLEHLHQHGIQSLLVEGGSLLLQSFIDADLWDEAYVETAPIELGDGVPAPQLPNGCTSQQEHCFGHIRTHYENLHKRETV